MVKQFFAALLVLGIMLTAGLPLTAPPVGAETIKLNYANFPPAPTFPCVQMERWAKEVEKRTNGQVKVTTFPGGTLLGAKNMLDGVISGLADIGCFCPPYIPGRFPLMAGIDLPNEFTSATVASATLWDLYQKYQPQSFAKVKVLTMFTCAPANIMSKVAVQKTNDLQKLEIRGTGISAKYLNAMGAIPVAMPMSSVPESLQKGVVKGLFSSLEVMKDFKFAELCKHVTITNGPTTSFAVVMNKSKWDSLPADVKKVFDDLGREQAIWTGQYEDQHVEEAIAWSKQEKGVSVYRFSDEESAQIKDSVKFMTDDYLKEAAAAGLPGKEFLDDLFTLKDKYEKEYGK
ncbi:MAG: TRAP transporter substrate-binding protein [Deltaproteobacteria bacterium]|nr:TRAP transporter substrate-binding protein [Candidatus Anaeroferrophillus wilburensis]MBN2887822.1 TRAP transporter substrate-binding protein [Deltaproteobacteria bacterium]